jgi:hypothetical protein
MVEEYSPNREVKASRCRQPGRSGELEDVAGATPRFHVWLGKTIRWGPPEDGIAIEVVDRDGGLGRLTLDP